MLQLSMRLINQTMTNCNFGINTDFKSDKDLVKKLDINIEASIAKNIQNKQLGITIVLSLFKGESSAEYPFFLKVTTLSLYEVSDEVLKEEYEEDIIKTTFTNLYPYLRTCVSTITSLGGFAPISLPNINLNDYPIEKE